MERMWSCLPVCLLWMVLITHHCHFAPCLCACFRPVVSKRVGLNILSGAPAREDAVVQDLSGNVVGVVTSGTHSPVLKRAISMAYVSPAHAAIGTKLKVVVRGKLGDAEVTKMPFVPTKYYKL